MSQQQNPSTIEPHYQIVCKELVFPPTRESVQVIKAPKNLLSEPLGKNHVRIKILYGCLNYADALQVGGKYQEKVNAPFIPGRELAGIVCDVNGGGDRFKIGDSVILLAEKDGWQSFIDLPIAYPAIIKVPKSVDLKKAASLLVAYSTSHVALTHPRHGALTQYDSNSKSRRRTVLVLGASGGVGLAAVQIAKSMGAINGKADFTVNYSTNKKDWFKQVLEFVCERHTTSKLSSFDDLKSIATFGFRGEALASVSVIAHVSITSRTEQQTTSLYATYKDGKLTGPMKKRSGARGTIIRAENLFYPDYIKHRRDININAEAKNIQKMISCYALFSTGVSITLKKQGETKPLLHTLTKNSVRQNIKTLYGPKIEKEIIEADINNEKIELTGKMYFTNVNYSSKERIFILFINKRLVTHTLLKKGVMSVFEPYLPKSTFPFVFLSINVNPKKIDVNVHPTKKEVAILDENRIIEEVKDVLRKKLLGSNSSRVFEVAQKATPSKSFTPIFPPNLINDDDDDQPIIPTPLISPKPSTQKELPKNKVRTNASDQTGQIHQYFPSLKRNFTEEDEDDSTPTVEPPTKKKKENSQSKSPEEETEEDVDELESLKSLRNSIISNTHGELEKLLRSSTYVGYINAKYSLVQFNDRLILLDLNAVTQIHLYQRVLAKFGRFKKINLKNPLSIKTILQGVSDNEEVIREALSVLNEKKEILQEYFSVCITEDLKLVALPHVLENYIPPLHRVPDFLYALAFKVDWNSEIGCFNDVSTVISTFYNLCEDFELEEETFSQKSSQEVNANSTLYSKQRMRWITEHLVYPSIKIFFKPPESLVNDGSIAEVANLPELFKVFERC